VFKQNQQADGEIHEDQLLNFLVNTLTGAFGLSLGENADIDLEDIYEDLVGARRRRVVHRHTTTRSTPLQQAIRYRSNLPAVGVVADFHDDQRPCSAALVRRDQPSRTERLAVSPLGVRGDAPPRRASPLVVALRGVHSNGHSRSVERAVGSAVDPSEPPTRRPIRTVTPDRVSLVVSGNAVVSAAISRRRRQLLLLAQDPCP